MVLALCWLAGEYVNSNVCKCSVELMNDYYDVLELYVFERIAEAKMSIEEMIITTSTTNNENRAGNERMSENEIQRTRSMLVAISSITKLASRWQDLTSRVIICLLKVLSSQNYFHSSVSARAAECSQLLKFPSIASSILDYPRDIIVDMTESHIDQNSSLPFLLQPSRTIGQQSVPRVAKLHPFEL